MISRNYRGDVLSNSIEKFLPLVLEQEEESVSTPIVVWGDVTFVYIKYNNLYIVATTKINANAALIFTFLHRLVQVSKSANTGSNKFFKCFQKDM